MADNVQIEPGRPRPADGLKQRIWMRMLTIEQHTMLTTAFFFAVVLVGAWVAINEPNRMQKYDNQYVARSIQRGASIFDTNCSPCHGKRGEGIEGVAPTLHQQKEFDGSRLKELGFAGTLQDYFTLTVSAGRPARSNPDWPNPMPTWSQDYGGPLRPDQIGDVVNFVMNWGCEYNYKYNAVCQGQDISFTPGPTLPLALPTSTPQPPRTVDQILSDLVKVQGDAARGQAIFTGAQKLGDGKVAGCNGCHSVEGKVIVGPPLNSANKDMPGSYTSFEFYVVESIVQPEKYRVPGFENAKMPGNFYNRLTDQDLADILTYLKSVQTK